MSTDSKAALEKFIDSKIPRDLRENFERDISMIRGGWDAAMDFVKRSIPVFRREPPDKSGLWWWWNEDEDSSPIPVSIAFSGSAGFYFAESGQWGWNRFQKVTEMGGFWMECVEPSVPSFEARMPAEKPEEEEAKE